MAISINDFRVAIRIDNSEAKAKFDETREQIAKVREEMQKLEADGKKDSAAYKELEKQQDKLNKSLYGLRKEAGLTSLSYNELRKGARSLKAQMDNAIPGTEKWKELRADYMLTKQRMKELEVQARDTKFSLSKMADGFNKYAAIGASAIASLTGVAMTARKCVDEFAEMQEAESQVRKYTGMTAEEVKGLNEEFKQMDTRTPREKLNALAGDAGRLGITAKKDVLEFVDAADKINVALGEDLGEDAVKNIGKLAQMFGEDEKLGLRGAMLSTGSAINEVAQNSSAAEAYLVAFTARVAGAANQAKVAQGDILGYASVLDQNMQQQEMAATAFQTLMMKMYQEPAKFAKIAGQSVEEFSSLIKNDANEAILQFLDTLNKKGGLDQLAPMFKEMGLDGVRASGVISTMAGKINDIRDAQKLANDAYRDGTSIINEFNVQNNTVQAGLDKARKNFKDVRVELGEKLQPVMKYMITTGSLTVKGLSALVSVLYEYKGAILTATALVAAYTAAVKAQELWVKRLTVAKALEWLQEKKSIITRKASLSGTLMLSAAKYALSGNIERATTMMKRFNTVSKGNLLGLLASLAVGAGIAIYKFATRTSDAEKAVKSFMEQSEKERNQLRTLIEATKAAGDKTQRRKELIEEINTKYGQYLPYLLDEYSSLKDIEQAYRDVNSEMDRNLAKKVLQEKTDEIQNETLSDKVDEMNDIREALAGTLPQSQIDDFLQKMILATEKNVAAGNTAKNIAKALTKNLEKYYSDRSDIPKVQGQIQDYVEVVEKAAKRINKVKAEMNPFINTPAAKKKANVLDEVVITPDYKGNDSGSNGDDKALEKELKAKETVLQQHYQEQQNILKEKFLNEKLTQDEYQQELYKAEATYLLSRKALLEKYGKDTSQIQGQIYDKMIAEANRLYQSTQMVNKNTQSDILAQQEGDYQEQVQDIKRAYLEGDIKTEADYQERLKEQERQYLEERRDMLAAYGEDTSSIDNKLLDMDIKDKNEGKAKQRESGYKTIDNTSDFEQKNNILQAMYDADLITYQEYEEEKTRINEEHEQLREEQAKAALDVIGQAAAAASQVVSALQDAEISKVTRKYDKQIKAAKKAGKDTTKLEEEKEEAINQVKKKYADKQFAASVLQVTATTAVAAMESYKAMSGIPIVGPALGAIAAAAAIASGAAQIAVAKQQRDEAKGLKEGGYSDDYVEGYTRSGNSDDVAGVIPVHKNEFVANHESVANPHVRQFLDVFDVAQKNGTIRMINTTQILEQVRTRSGKYAGGFVDEKPSGTSFAASDISSSGLTPELRTQLIELIKENNRLLQVICNKELIVDARKMRDSIKRVEQLEKNVSR
ncbi:phage tail tape measure protein [Bacteroides intestinalis]|jgi:TP901 family phage tail tape measure protein|uniref:phage tail tape measure protein n=1 Tax=Bacteroides intestinalis TaxID=329854 RepID=UPI0015FD0781|nr:phage tail tape measure protein [Bacteroides intestinalis]